MNKKYIVRLSDAERGECEQIVTKLKGGSQKARRAQILLKSDADGPAWTDLAISAAFNCRTRTIENLRQRVLVKGFALALDGKQRENSPTPSKLDGQGEAKLIAMRLGTPPVGYGRWTLQLLAEQMVTLDIVDRICAETVRKTLKKQDNEAHDRVLGDPSRAEC